MKDLWLWLKWQLNRLFPKCPHCQYGRIHHLGEYLIRKAWINVYECDQCNRWYV